MIRWQMIRELSMYKEINCQWWILHLYIDIQENRLYLLRIEKDGKKLKKDFYQRKLMQEEKLIIH